MLFGVEMRMSYGVSMFSYVSVLFDHTNAENLAQWNSGGKSFVAQKLVQTIIAGNLLTSISVAAMQKSSGVLMMTN